VVSKKKYQFLFVNCYSSATAEVFKINDNGFYKVISLFAKDTRRA